MRAGQEIPHACDSGSGSNGAAAADPVSDGANVPFLRQSMISVIEEREILCIITIPITELRVGGR